MGLGSLPCEPFSDQDIALWSLYHGQETTKAGYSINRSAHSLFRYQSTLYIPMATKLDVRQCFYKAKRRNL